MFITIRCLVNFGKEKKIKESLELEALSKIIDEYISGANAALYTYNTRLYTKHIYFHSQLAAISLNHF